MCLVRVCVAGQGLCLCLADSALLILERGWVKYGTIKCSRLDIGPVREQELYAQSGPPISIPFQIPGSDDKCESERYLAIWNRAAHWALT